MVGGDSFFYVSVKVAVCGTTWGLGVRLGYVQLLGITDHSFLRLAVSFVSPGSVQEDAGSKCR